MDDEPRLTPEAHDALYLYRQSNMVRTIEDTLVLQTHSAEYLRGWNDCKAIILKTLGA